MTKEEAITILSNYDLGFYDINGHPIPQLKLAEACDMAIDALSAQADCDTISGRPHDMPKSADCISRQAARSFAAGSGLIRRMKDGDWIRVEEVRENIDWLPSADTVQVVRCKDCKYLYTDNGCPLRTWHTHVLDDYCSYGERKGGEDK